MTHCKHALAPKSSLKLSANGVSHGSSGAGHSARFAPATPRATPLTPTGLEPEALQNGIPGSLSS
jgi:hypothetical protein